MIRFLYTSSRRSPRQCIYVISAIRAGTHTGDTPIGKYDILHTRRIIEVIQLSGRDAMAVRTLLHPRV